MTEYRGKVYVFGGFVAPATGGGWEPIDNVWEYDPVANSWKALAPLPSQRGSAVAVEVGGKIHVIGGATTAEGSKDVAISNATTVRNLTLNDVYDVASNTWSSAARQAALSGAPAKLASMLLRASCQASCAPRLGRAANTASKLVSK